MSSQTASPSVVHTSNYNFDVERYAELGHYSAMINGYEIGKIDYTETARRVVLLSVGIVSSFRRQGIATEFIARVLDDVRGRGKTVTVDCPVIGSFLSRFPSYRDLVDPARPGSSAALARGDESGGATELTPFENPFWDRHADGLYVDRASGEALFASVHAFDSGTGLPSFTASVAPENLALRYESIFAVHRTEVRSRRGDNHIGYVYTDGTPDDSCLRYTVDSAAVRFIPLGELEANGYSTYRDVFTERQENGGLHQRLRSSGRTR